MVVALDKPLDLADLRGQDRGKRALEIAAAGGHHLAMIGPAGCGKSTLAATLAGLLTAPAAAKQDEIARLYSAAGRSWRLDSAGAVPVIAPSVAVTAKTLLGAKGRRQVGELALANHGVVIVDDADRFQPRALDAIREALDRGEVHPVGAAAQPSLFQLVVTAQTSLCKPCHACDDPFDCELRHIRPSLSRFIDIVDLQIILEPPTPADWSYTGQRDSSARMAERVASARLRQAQRGVLNRDLSWSPSSEASALDPDAVQLLDLAVVAQLHTARDRMAVLRIARTLADLEDRDRIRRVHVAEALIYRFLPARIYRRKRKPTEEAPWFAANRRRGA